MNATEDKMSRTMAAFFLAEMARTAVSETQVTALRTACRSLLKRHFDQMGNRIRRRARKAACQGSAKTTETCQPLAKPAEAVCQGPANPAPDCQPLAKTARDVCQALANPPFGCRPPAKAAAGAEPWVFAAEED